MIINRNLISLCLFYMIFISYNAFSFQNDWNTLPNSSLFQQKNKKLFINNKILFKVRNRIITVIDVLHKMNLLFYRNYPHLINSNESMVQFYNEMWPIFFESIIDDFLICSDADEKKILIDSTDVKKEIKKLFGNELINITSAFNMTEEEIFKVIERDLIVQKMLGMMVHSKASLLISPKMVKEAYQKKVQTYVPEKNWNYIILNFDSSNNDTLAFATEVRNRIIEKGSFNEKEIHQMISQNNIKMRISSLLKGTEDSLSQIHKDILMNISNNLCSDPLPYKQGHRLFIIKEMFSTKIPPFSELEEQLRLELLEKFFEKQEIIYREKLREKYAFNKNLILQEFSSPETISNLFSWLS